MAKCARQSPDDLEPELLPKVDRGCVRGNDKIELHRAKTKPTRLAEGMLSHLSSRSQSARVFRNHIGGVRNVRSGSGLIRSQNVGADNAPIVFCNKSVRVGSKPIRERLFTRHPWIKCVGVARGDNLMKNIPDGVAIRIRRQTNSQLPCFH